MVEQGHKTLQKKSFLGANESQFEIFPGPARNICGNKLFSYSRIKICSSGGIPSRPIQIWMFFQTIARRHHCLLRWNISFHAEETVFQFALHTVHLAHRKSVFDNEATIPPWFPSNSGVFKFIEHSMNRKFIFTYVRLADSTASTANTMKFIVITSDQVWSAVVRNARRNVKLTQMRCRVSWATNNIYAVWVELVELKFINAREKLFQSSVFVWSPHFGENERSMGNTIATDRDCEWNDKKCLIFSNEWQRH